MAEKQLIELSGVPEFYADGNIIRDLNEVVRLVFYVDTCRGAESILTVVMRRSGFIRSRQSQALLMRRPELVVAPSL